MYKVLERDVTDGGKIGNLVECPDCWGKGRVIGAVCANCEGDGKLFMEHGSMEPGGEVVNFASGPVGGEGFGRDMGRYGFSRDPSEEREDSLTRDFAFNRHSMNDGHHVSPLDNGTVQVGTDGINVRLVQGIDEESFRRVLSRAQRATIGFDLAGEEGDDNSDWEEMMKGGLQTALETQIIVFEVSGVSRTATHQLVRSRRASFHQQSQRASFMGYQPEVRMPESIFNNPRAREAFIKAVAMSHEAYRVATEEDISYQDSRFILPEGTDTYIMCEYSVREFLNLYAYRACSMFQWEIVAVTRMMGDLLREAYPWLGRYIKISCEATHPDEAQRRCTFQGWEAVEGQCDFPWAKEERRTYKPEAHRIVRPLPVVSTEPKRS